MTGLALLHGWGYGPETWDGFAEALGASPVAMLHAGYFGPRRMELPSAPGGWVGIGHSLGFARLLEMDVPWRGLVGIGGFLRFCHKPGMATGTPTAVLNAMVQRLDVAPEDVLARFRRRCGHTATCAAMPLADGQTRLRQDLLHLRDLDLATPEHPVPTLLIQARDDRIVSPELAHEAQSLLPGSRLELLDQGGHALPITRAGDCQRLIQGFLRDLG